MHIHAPSQPRTPAAADTPCIGLGCERATTCAHRRAMQHGGPETARSIVPFCGQRGNRPLYQPVRGGQA